MKISLPCVRPFIKERHEFPGLVPVKMHASVLPESEITGQHLPREGESE